MTASRDCDNGTCLIIHRRRGGDEDECQGGGEGCGCNERASAEMRILPKPGLRLFAIAWMLLPLAALAQGLPAAEPEGVGLSPERLARIAPALRRDIAAGLLPGAVILGGGPR